MADVPVFPPAKENELQAWSLNCALRSSPLVSEPASIASRSSITNALVRCLGVSPPWQPTTRSSIRSLARDDARSQRRRAAARASTPNIAGLELVRQNRPLTRSAGQIVALCTKTTQTACTRSLLRIVSPPPSPLPPGREKLTGTKANPGT